MKDATKDARSPILFFQTRVTRWEARIGIECVGIISEVAHLGDFKYVAVWIDENGEDRSDHYSSLTDAQTDIYLSYVV